LSKSLHTDETPTHGDPMADEAAKAQRRQRVMTVAGVGAAVVVGALFFTAGGGSSTAPNGSAPTGSGQSAQVTTGPSGPTAPTVSVVESTAVGSDAMAIGSSGTFSTEEGSGVVTVSSARWQETAESTSGLLPVIEVEIEVTTGEFMVTAASFGLQDSKGNIYPPLSGAVGDGEFASGQLLGAGGKASGVVAFDAPRLPFTLLYSNPSSADLLTWRMPE